MRSVTLAVLAAGLMAGPTLAQTGSPPKAKAKSQTEAKTPKPKKSLAGAGSTRISNSPHPSYDNDTARRISAAMLSYSTLEVRGGWPTLPADVTKLAPGASGPEVALLRERLAITDDLPPSMRAATSSTPISRPPSSASSRATGSKRPARSASARSPRSTSR